MIEQTRHWKLFQKIAKDLPIYELQRAFREAKAVDRKLGAAYRAVFAYERKWMEQKWRSDKSKIER